MGEDETVTEKVKFGNCYQFDLPDNCLTKDETDQVIQALLFDLKRTPEGETFVLDIAIGPDMLPNMEWSAFVDSQKVFKRAGFKREPGQVKREDVVQFLREHFADMLTLPAPTLKRIK